MSKGKEAIAHQKMVIERLKIQIKGQFDQIATLKEEKLSMAEQLIQMQTYKDRLQAINQLNDELMSEKKIIDNLMKEIALWKYRAYILAEADRDNEESLFSTESLAVLTDMDMLPKSMVKNRHARRATKTGSATKRQLHMIENTMAEMESKSVKVKLGSV